MNKADLGVERSLVLLKPDTVARGLVGNVTARFENAGLKIVGMTMRRLDSDLAQRHYADLAERAGEDVYRATAAFMMSGPVIAVAIEGVNAVAKVRALIGSTFPDQAPPGTIRGDFAHQTKHSADITGKAVMNLVHASGTSKEAEYEIGVWFTESELFEYETVAERYAF